MLRKGLVIMLSVAMLVGCMGACSEKNNTEENVSIGLSGTETIAIDTEPVETTEPDDGSIKFYYDDRIAPEELGCKQGSSVQIIEQHVESTKIASNDPDDNVLIYDEDSGVYIAVGVGTAQLDVDGTQVLIRVKPAPISLFMITGHSLGAGQCGVAEQSVASEAGQVYSSHKTSTFQEASEIMGIGYTASVKPAGIDAFSCGGGGTIGEGSGIAWKWNQLTGEKVWVLNAAVGGSVIPEWQKGGKYYTPAVAMYRAAAQVLKNEVSAGHYFLKNTAIIYHSAANFGYKNVEFDDAVMEFWYDSMYNGFLNDLAMDINGDGEVETVQALGFLPSWKGSQKGKYPYDKPINYYMSLSDAYPGCFMVGETMRNWYDDGLLAKNFPAIAYETQSEPVNVPATPAEMFAEDEVHFAQVVYNAAGLEIGENLYRYFRTSPEAETFYVYTSNGMLVEDSLRFKKVGSSHALIVEVYPITVSDFTIEISDNLQLSSPFNLKATAEGEGYIRLIRDGEVIWEVSVTVGN